VKGPPASDPTDGFWQSLAVNLDAAPFSPSGKFQIPLVSVMAVPPLNPDGRADGRGVDQAVGEAPGRWSNVRVFLDVPASFAVLDDVLFTLWAVTQGVPTIVAQAAVSAMGLEAYNVASPIPRLRGLALGGSGMPGISWRVTCRSKSDFFAFVDDPTPGSPTYPLGTVALECWGTESPLGPVQGTPGASLGHGGLRDVPVTVYGSELLGWNAESGVWLPVAVSLLGELVTTPAPALSRGVFQGVSLGSVQVGRTKLLAVHGTNGAKEDLFLQLFDSATVPNVGDAPTYVYSTKGQVTTAGGGAGPSSAVVDAYPHPFSDGLMFAWSDVSYKYSVPPTLDPLVVTFLYN
jgi:hypothetical protein